MERLKPRLVSPTLIQEIQMNHFKVIQRTCLMKKRKKRAKMIVPEIDIDAMWHPSPASPLANRNGGADWRANVASKLPVP